MKHRVEMQFNGKTLSMETGEIAKQANGSVWVTYGNNVVLVTVCMDKEPKAGSDFFPLTVDYIEKMYSSGKIPGGFFKRESKPNDEAILKARMIDRPLRPLFSEGMRNPVSIVVTIFSYDGSMAVETLGTLGASAALSISNIPFEGPVAGVVIGQKDGKWLLNPSREELKSSRLALSVSGTKDAIMMVEAHAAEISESDMLAALQYAHEQIGILINLQLELVRQINPQKVIIALDEVDPVILKEVQTKISGSIREALHRPKKLEKYDALDKIKHDLVAEYTQRTPVSDQDTVLHHAKNAYETVKKDVFRALIVKDKFRDDGRTVDAIRALSGRVGVLPSPHGSALFTRGETQAIGTVTLGTGQDIQLIDGLDPKFEKPFFLHYNFPPYSVGEAGMMRSPGRREVGHGFLAERAVAAILPDRDQFPYVIRLVSDITESNGSSSMASVCVGTLALMDAGVPIKRPVAGIAMGLIKEGDAYTILTDIAGMEDHMGDMDFKVAGSRQGITALQMDIKIQGVTPQIMSEALQQAQKARLAILDFMQSVIDKPRTQLAATAPRLEVVQVRPDQVGLVIGPGGKMIRSIVENSGAKIDIDDDGKVTIAATTGEGLRIARQMIEALTKDVEVGQIYDGRVVTLKDFGAFVEVLPGKEGLLHISQISEQRVNRIQDVLQPGDSIRVKVREIDAQGRINLTAKQLT